MNAIRRSVLLVIATLAGVADAHATVYQYNITYRITDFLSLNEPFGPFVRGEEFSGHFTIDTSVAQNGSFLFFDRHYPNAAQFEFSVHGVTFAATGDVLIENDSNVFSLLWTFESRPGDGWTRTQALDSPFAGPFTSFMDGGALFNGPRDLANWPAAQISMSRYSLIFGEATYTFPNGRFTSFGITGDALSLRVLSLTLVPEPSTIGLAAVGLVGVAAAMWRRRTFPRR